jgi:hypothetical protein
MPQAKILGAFFATQKTGLCGGSVTAKSKKHALHDFFDFGATA